MMNYKIWEEIILHLFVLCGVRKMSDAEHSLYMADMYSELKTQFTDADIGKAARAIAENENLYGNYPPLSVWLKYCPRRRAEKILQNQESSDFLSNIEWLIDFDPISPQYNNGVIENIQRNIEKFGKRAESVIEQNGGLIRIRENGRTSKFNRENILREIRDMWNASAIDADTGALQIAANTTLQIENKN